MNFPVQRAVFRPRHLALEPPAVLVLHVFDQHHELRPGPVDDGPVARVEGGGDVVDGQQLGDGTGCVVPEQGRLPERARVSRVGAVRFFWGEDLLLAT